MPIVNSEGPKFKKGDLVVLRDPDRLMSIGGVGIVVSDPVLIFVNDWESITEFPVEFWVYDVYAGEQLFTEVPQQMIRSLTNEVESKNS